MGLKLFGHYPVVWDLRLMGMSTPFTTCDQLVGEHL